MKSIKYKYRLRSGYRSHSSLIEFVDGVENSNFGSDLFDALSLIQPKVEGMEDLWVNDEKIYSVRSNMGTFTLSKDLYDIAFILAEENQDCINKINELLMKDDRFEMLLVDNKEKNTEDKLRHFNYPKP